MDEQFFNILFIHHKKISLDVSKNIARKHGPFFVSVINLMYLIKLIVKDYGL